MRRRIFMRGWGSSRIPSFRTRLPRDLFCGTLRSVALSPKRQSFPPDLSKVPSEFKILCDDHGGPVPLSDTVELRSFELACGQFPFGRSWNAYREWEPDKTEAMRHWPWVALAADQYRFEREAKAQYANEPKRPR